MKQSECAELYEAMLGLLAESGLKWVADQVELSTSIGKPFVKEVESIGTESGYLELPQTTDFRSPRRRKKESIPTTIDYEPNEKLAILVDAVERTVVQTGRMERNMLKEFGSQVSIFEGIEFSYGSDVKSPIRIGVADVERRLANCEHLSEALESIRKEL